MAPDPLHTSERSLHGTLIDGNEKVQLGQRAQQPGTGSNTGRPLWLDRAAREIEGLSRPETVGLIAGDRADGLAVLHQLGLVFGATPVSITEVMLSRAPVRRRDDLTQWLAGCPLLFDLEVLCWDRGPSLDLMRALRLHARQHGTVALWPGRIAERVATFSAPGRRDYVRVALTNVTVLRPVPTRFPDEVPFEIERIP